MSAAVAFDFDNVVPTVQRAHSAANRDDAEDAVQVAVAEGLEKGWDLTARNVVACARFRLLNMMERREARNLSLDSFLEQDVDSAPREIAIEEVDFESHVRLAEGKQNPIIRLRIEAAEAGRRPVVAEWTKDLIVTAIRAFEREEGRRPTKVDCIHDPRLPARKLVERLFGNWSTAMDAAGVDWRDDGTAKRWTPETALATFRDFMERHGRPPTASEFRARGSRFPGYTAIERMFGTSSISRVCELAHA